VGIGTATSAAAKRGEFLEGLSHRPVGLCEQGAPRGKTVSGKSAAVFRTARRQESRHIRARVESVGRDVLSGKETPEPGRARLLATRKAVEAG
jgi:hypothetical protein